MPFLSVLIMAYPTTFRRNDVGSAMINAVYDREEARELARRELSDPAYDREESLFRQVVDWIMERIQSLLDGASGALSSSVGTAILVAVIAAAVVLIIVRAGPMARRSAHRAAVLADDGTSASDYRAAAASAADAGDWATAVVERFRAVIATLEERGIIDRRSGRTADEAARDGGSALPPLRTSLVQGASLFDTVRYGHRAATSSDYTRVVELDDAVRSARPSGDAEEFDELVAPR